MTEGDEGSEKGTRVTVGAVARPLPPPKRRATERTATVTAAERRVAGLASAGLAAPALVLPIPWLVVVVLVRLAAGTHHRAAVAEQRVSVPLALAASAGSGARAFFGHLPGQVIRLAATAVLAVAVPATVAGLVWLASSGSAGALVAGRLAAYAHAVGLLSAIVCWRLLRSPGAGGDRTALLRGVVSSMSEGALLAAGVASIGFILLLALALSPSTWAPWSSLADAAGVLPAATRTAVLDAQSSAVRSEVDATLRCLRTAGTDAGWVQRDPVRTVDGTLSVRIARNPAAASTLYSVSALVLALQNQLPAAVGSLVVRRRADFNPLVVNRAGLSLSAPAIDTTRLAAAAHVDRSILPMSSDVTRLGLKCGAAAL